MNQRTGCQRQRRKWGTRLTGQLGFFRDPPYGRDILRVNRPHTHNVSTGIDTIDLKPRIAGARQVNPVTIVLTPLHFIRNRIFHRRPGGNQGGDANPLRHPVEAGNGNVVRCLLSPWGNNGHRTVFDHRAIIHPGKLVRVIRQAVNSDRAIVIVHNALNPELLNGQV